jgi:DNA mismatch repair protein MutH
VATSNHPAVDKLIQAGADLQMQTTVPEMDFAAVTWTDLWGSRGIPGTGTTPLTDRRVGQALLWQLA